MKRILLICGVGIATSLVIKHKVSEILDKNGFAGTYTLENAKVEEINDIVSDYDLCVSTVGLDKTRFACPLVIGTQLLIDYNTEPVIEEILTVLR